MTIFFKKSVSFGNDLSLFPPDYRAILSEGHLDALPYYCPADNTYKFEGKEVGDSKTNPLTSSIVSKPHIRWRPLVESLEDHKTEKLLKTIAFIYFKNQPHQPTLLTKPPPLQEWLFTVKNPEQVKFVLNLDSKLDLNTANKMGRPPLVEAILRNRPKAIAPLIDAGANPFISCTVEKKTYKPLALAAILNHSEVVTALVSKGKVDPNEVDSTGLTALHWAVHLNQHEAIEALLANDQTDPNKTNNNDQTALHLATQLNNSEAIKALLTSDKTDPNKPNKEKKTPLCCAIAGKALKALTALLEDKRIDPNEADEIGKTPLHSAVLTKNFMAMRVLLASKRVNPNEPDEDGRTPLHWSIVTKNLKAMRILLSNKQVNSSLVDKRNGTALDWALIVNYIQGIDELLEHGCHTSLKTVVLGSFQDKKTCSRILTTYFQEKNIPLGSGFLALPVALLTAVGIETYKQFSSNFNSNEPDRSEKTPFNASQSEQPLEMFFGHRQ